MGDRISRQPDTLRAELVGRASVSGRFLVGAIPNPARVNVAPILLIDFSNRRRRTGSKEYEPNFLGSFD
jgi:hypothetical protein